jgi:hypothetical protein
MGSSSTKRIKTGLSKSMSPKFRRQAAGPRDVQRVGATQITNVGRRLVNDHSGDSLSGTTRSSALPTIVDAVTILCDQANMCYLDQA